MEKIDGKALSIQIKEEIKKKIDEIKAEGGKIPHLAAILVGHDGASETYVRNKEKACEKTGIKSTVLRFEDDITEVDLLKEVEALNNDDAIDGFIVQLPLPNHIDEQKVVEAIKPEKDVDGFHPVNIGRMTLGMPAYISATPFGILTMLKRYDIETEGKHVVVLGRSNIVGRPVSILLGQKSRPGNATVTLCHSRTKDVKKITSVADILIVALGKAKYVKSDMVKQGAVVIDVGITRVKSDKTKSGWKLLGDVDFDDVAPKCSYITPVPGGVGPMTIVALLHNTVAASKGENYKN
ncbi:MAG: bifunctional methylenetetrahydrofolate dehydrogenase/methenyltetrahydrofolate cyclohydrolase FolD [Bacteroidota bacterium]|nr:bifunctional methylenetetrahydrofolate dehydrogenase/methenyltetrahydrofolate cyclohydrolase FolD [Bacteroidota bacterium]